MLSYIIITSLQSTYTNRFKSKVVDSVIIQYCPYTYCTYYVYAHASYYYIICTHTCVILLSHSHADTLIEKSTNTMYNYIYYNIIYYHIIYTMRKLFNGIALEYYNNHVPSDSINYYCYYYYYLFLCVVIIQ